MRTRCCGDVNLPFNGQDRLQIQAEKKRPLHRPVCSGGNSAPAWEEADLGSVGSRQKHELVAGNKPPKQKGGGGVRGGERFAKQGCAPRKPGLKTRVNDDACRALPRELRRDWLSPIGAD